MLFAFFLHGGFDSQENIGAVDTLELRLCLLFFFSFLVAASKCYFYQRLKKPSQKSDVNLMNGEKPA